MTLSHTWLLYQTPQDARYDEPNRGKWTVGTIDGGDYTHEGTIDLTLGSHETFGTYVEAEAYLRGKLSESLKQ